jgi:two-component system sensor histidine kinase YesM
MSYWKNTRFQTKLFALFILLSSIPTLLLGAIAYHKSSVMFREQMQQDLNVILAQVNTAIERQIGDFDRFTMLPYYLPDIFSFLNKPAASPDQWGSAEIDAQRTMARLMSAYPSINSSISGLMVFGMNGSMNGYRISGNSTLNMKEDVRGRAWYQEVMERKGGFVITGVEAMNIFNGETFQGIVGSRLLMDEDYRPLAVIAIFISANFIPNIVSSLELPTVGVTVLDGQRNVIYASNPELAARLDKNEAGSKKGVWESAISEERGSLMYSGVFQKSDYLGWDIYMGVDQNEMLKGSRSIRNFTLIIVIAIFFVAGIVSWLLARGLSKPIYRLIRSMRAVERGDFSIPAALERGDEMGRLESSYGRMVQRLDSLIHSIEEKERQKRHAELYALRARIQPHFLYNTLNSIRMLAILQQSTQIAKLIQALNKLLHANMKLDSELVPLQEEIRILKDYVSLMDLRYTHVFEVNWLVPPELGHAAVPPMLLQPIVENAIFHGANGLERTLNITVKAALTPEQRTLLLEIVDDGIGFKDAAPDLALLPENLESSAHIGLRNVNDRIRLRFGEEYGLFLERRDGLTHVMLRMAYKPLEREDDADVEFARS